MKENRWQTKIRIANYIGEEKRTSRQKIAAALGYSMPTVVQNVKELIDYGLLCEIGEFESTGGRKAKMLAIRPGFRCAVGVEITKSDVRCVLLDLDDTELAFKRIPFPYENTLEYYTRLGELVEAFIEETRTDCPIVGIGISLPGVVNPELGVLQTSYGLQVSNISLRSFSQNLPYEICFERDATSAARSEISNQTGDMIYLFLSSTVGGAIYLHGRFFRGDFYRAGGFGHSIIVSGGKPCFCGKRGCFAAYCSSEALLSGPNDTLEAFFSRVEKKNQDSIWIWEEYMDKLAIAITNLRMDFDCSIVLGGEISEFLPKYLQPIEMKMQRYNRFDLDTSYLSIGRYHKEAAAIGAAQKMIGQYIQHLNSSI